MKASFTARYRIFQAGDNDHTLVGEVGHVNVANPEWKKPLTDPIYFVWLYCREGQRGEGHGSAGHQHGQGQMQGLLRVRDDEHRFQEKTKIIVTH